MRSACLAAGGSEWQWCETPAVVRGMDRRVSGLGCSLAVQAVPLHRLPSADQPGAVAPRDFLAGDGEGRGGGQLLLNGRWEAPACAGRAWRELLVVLPCAHEQGGAGLRVLLLTGRDGEDAPDGGSVTLDLIQTLDPGMSNQTVAAGSEEGAGWGGRLLAFDVSGWYLAIGDRGGGAHIFRWDAARTGFRPAGVWVPDPARDGLVTGLAVMALEQPLLLASFGSCDTRLALTPQAPRSPAPALAVVAAAAADDAADAGADVPSHLPWRQQESFYITPQCLFPLDRACRQVSPPTPCARPRRGSPNTQHQALDPRPSSRHTKASTAST